MSSPLRHRQRGLTLIESLIAILVAALGILGVLGVQMRTLTDTQTTVRRAQAVRLIEDLSERIRVQPNSLANLNAYVIGWEADTTTAAPRTQQAGTLCTSTACSTAQFAAYDIREWKRLVEISLPLADANVFVAPGDSSSTNNRRQLGVMLSWRENEKSADTDYTASLNAAADGGTVSCPTGRICHLQYIPLAARCAPYLGAGGSTPLYYCAGG
ncbi:type IV pilus modification protein PilV [Ottowia sp. GY511]|uniref:Type IV pilus modification protein PilV n=1 Tax=Ottowia flava TaxID=2675430 RepID=A0ABW4KVJ4_9BURK|nr:type IV pilus modification protein PilV [Ottowia sp. GY511]TXK31398.1 type IV pilus modification protein PilV [Ottowia sp. GY511]